MRTAYRILAYVIAAEVVVQAMAMVFGVAGLGKWVEDGGVFDKSLMESEGSSPFPEVIGFAIHGMNGMMVIPALALILLVVSFFTPIPGSARWAALVLLLVVLQISLGLLGHAIPALGALHGFNALALFTAALYTARRAHPVTVEQAADSDSFVARA